MAPLQIKQIQKEKTGFKIKIHSVGKKLKFFKQKYQDILTSKTLTIDEKIDIIVSPVLNKNYKYLTNTYKNSIRIAEKRKELQLDNTYRIEFHLLKRDTSGKTIGCGCTLCQLKHLEYKVKQELDHYSKEYSKYQRIKSIIDSSLFYNTIPFWDPSIGTSKVRIYDAQNKIREVKQFIPRLGQNSKANQDPFEFNRTDPFKHELINRFPCFPVYLSHPEYVNKKLIKIEETIQRLKPKYKTLVTGRNYMANAAFMAG